MATAVISDDQRPPTATSAWSSPRNEKQTPPAPPRPLFVTVLGAKNLRNDRGMPAVDPFCICRTNQGPDFRTRSRNSTTDTLNPAWDYEVVVKDYTCGDDIHFIVYDDLSSVGGSTEMLGSASLPTDRFCSPGATGFHGELRLARPRTKFDAGSAIRVMVALEEAIRPPSGNAPGMTLVPCSTEEEEKATWRFRGLRTLSAAAARMVVEPTPTPQTNAQQKNGNASGAPPERHQS